MDSTDILLIDDDAELGELLSDYLGREGYRVRVAPDGRTGLRLAEGRDWGVVLLDVMLPGLDGIEVLRELRKSSVQPVIMLTAKGEEVERIVGLELGADDYLPKPFNPRELLARIKAVLRRVHGVAPFPGKAPAEDAADTGTGEAGPGSAAELLACGSLVLDLAGYRATLAGEEVPLTSLEFALLRELMRARGRALSRDYLLDRVRGREFELYDRSIDVHISHLRNKLGDDPARPRFIRTVRAVGYMFIATAD
jgi:two-component system response regulator CpxR